MKKKPTLYIIVFAVWAGCAALLAFCLAQMIPAVAGEPWRRGLIAALLALNTAILAALWLGSIKDLVFSLAYALRRKALKRALQRQAAEGERALAGAAEPLPRVLLLYCTCNDFNEQALSRCRRQKYGNCKTVILDDSTDPACKRAAAKYALHHSNVEVVRRQDRSGYKAGNLNNYLRGRSDYDYFVVLDSDEVIPPDFISKALRYFAADENCGAVQARHVASEGKNMFQRLLGRSVAGNGRTVQVIKNFYGANALLGHGMMISRRCYQRAGGFPHVVAEDISFAVEIRNAGLSILYAPDIECSEEFPSSYLALKKRQCKWTQGNLEYMKRYSGQIFSAKMAWFEKADIILSHYSLPVVPVLSFLLTVCTVALGFLGYPVIGYALAVYAVMLLFLCSPMLPDLFLCRSKGNFLLLVPYFIVNVATYASLAPMMLRTVALGLLGKKAVFLITPKGEGRTTVKQALAGTWGSVAFALAVGGMALWACGSILPVIFIFAGCLAAPFLALLSDWKLKERLPERGRRPAAAMQANAALAAAARKVVAAQADCAHGFRQVEIIAGHDRGQQARLVHGRFVGDVALHRRQQRLPFGGRGRGQAGQKFPAFLREGKVLGVAGDGALSFKLAQGGIGRGTAGAEHLNEAKAGVFIAQMGKQPDYGAGRHVGGHGISPVSS